MILNKILLKVIYATFRRKNGNSIPENYKNMSKQSEEVLLIVNSVKNKKLDGVLYMMGERMAWMQTSKNSFTYSHPYADIKG